MLDIAWIPLATFDKEVVVKPQQYLSTFRTNLRRMTDDHFARSKVCTRVVRCECDLRTALSK